VTPISADGACRRIRQGLAGLLPRARAQKTRDRQCRFGRTCLIIVGPGSYREQLLMWKPVRSGRGRKIGDHQRGCDPAGRRRVLDHGRRGRSPTGLFGLAAGKACRPSGPRAAPMPHRSDPEKKTALYSCPAEMFRGRTASRSSRSSDGTRLAKENWRKGMNGEDADGCV